MDIDSQPNSTKPVSLSPYLSSNSSKKSMLSFDTYAYEEYIAITVNNKASYTMTAMAKEKKLIANFA